MRFAAEIDKTEAAIWQLVLRREAAARAEGMKAAASVVDRLLQSARKEGGMGDQVEAFETARNLILAALVAAAEQGGTHESA